VLVKVEYASINPVDYKLRRGDLRLVFGSRFPRVIGVDFAGVVAETGRSVKVVKAGDPVFGMANPLSTPYGSYAEYAIARVDELAVRPARLSAREAAALPIAGLTALEALKMMTVGPGRRLLVNGASGGVGSFAIQIAKAKGAVVHGTASGGNRGFVQDLGADEVFDYTETDVRELEEEYDGIFDASAKLKFSSVRHLLTPNGTYVTTLPTADAILAAASTCLLPGKKAQVVMVGVGRQIPVELLALAELVMTGTVRAVINKIVDLCDLPAAHSVAEQEHAQGKTLVKI
jgi:NADPH:quinone reductase-like Zn-dependent oxidoreductase